MPDESDLALIRILETLQGPTSLCGSQVFSSSRARNAWRLVAISQRRRLPIRSGWVLINEVSECGFSGASQRCHPPDVGLGPMENKQVHALLIAASILAAPRLASQLDSFDSPARETVITEAVRDAEHILRDINGLLSKPQT